jgi:hypothetical protein
MKKHNKNGSSHSNNFTQLFLIVIGLVINFFLSSRVQAQIRLLEPEQVDCKNVGINDVVETSEGRKPTSVYCQSQSLSIQQPALNIKNIQIRPRPPWGASYSLNGNICRAQGADTICLTPQQAAKLRWPKPPK